MTFFDPVGNRLTRERDGFFFKIAFGADLPPSAAVADCGNMQNDENR